MTDFENPLFDGWQEKKLTDEEEQQLCEWLNQDEQHMRQFVTANIREQQLRDAVRHLHHADEVERHVGANRPVRDVKMPRMLYFIFAAAATVLLATWLVLPSRPVSVQANVIAMTNARLTGVDGNAAIGEMISLGSFRLETGTLEIMLPFNVRVQFVAPVEATFESGKRLRLLEGSMIAEAGNGGEGFTVVTNAGEIVDLGTRFGLEVERDGESRLAVFSGEVEFYPSSAMASREVVRLTEGEALRFSARAGLRRWQQVAIEADRAGLSRVAHVGVVREVHDNLGEGNLRPFYSVIQGGMKPGALAFNDKPNPVWSASVGEEFPAWLEGADLIRTYYNFRYIEDYQLTLDLNEPADVYVLIVSPGQVPNWLKERFHPVEGASIRAGSWHPGMGDHPAATVESDGPYLNFSIWKCEAGPGELKLGAPLQHRVKGVHSLMYGLAVKAKSSS
ncbi:FecR family protein [Blastopirellula sp. J2-11]|uniref:FecR family protein n=1 Tax=Blastopirellula sp. J2-11 TaxID=2943192 RepID=UPI0021C907D9|nr:FecR family protein [Blastopirellula sp. J2-11]UUO04669.1 FecR family protein [Blastopirellula sp. J2-11]